MIVAHLSLSLILCSRMMHYRYIVLEGEGYLSRTGGSGAGGCEQNGLRWWNRSFHIYCSHAARWQNKKWAKSLTKINAKPLAALEALWVSYSFCNYCWLLQSWTNFFSVVMRQKSALRESAERMWTLGKRERSNVGPDATNWLLYKKGKRYALWRLLATCM